MKTFISWSGERSRVVAEALRDWIPLVLHYVEPWISQADIEAGQRWAQEVTKELEASNFGVICVTRENASSPWVLFEAGALAKSMQGSRVIPVLLDLEFRDITGPLAQFQAKKTDRAGLAEVIQSLNSASPHPIPDERVKQLFDALWPELEKKLSSIPKAQPASKHTRPQPEILEELVASIRTLESRFRDVIDEGPRSLRRRRMPFHPMMIHELGGMLSERRGDPISILVLASLFRDEAPWLYELGMEAYRTAKSGSADEATTARKRFQKAVEILRHSPFPPEEMGLDPRMMHMMVRELDHLLEAGPEGEDAQPPRARRKRREKAE